jgi:hypothetical protein
MMVMVMMMMIACKGLIRQLHEKILSLMPQCVATFSLSLRKEILFKKKKLLYSRVIITFEASLVISGG